MRALAMAVVLVCVAGCNGCLPPNVTVLGKDCRTMQRPLEGLVVAGEVAKVNAGLVISCTRSIPRKATGVAVTVSDTDGNAIAHTEAAVNHDAPWTHNVEIAFTPDRPGAYTVTATFAPNAGVATYEVQAVAKRQNPVTQLIPWDGPTDCAQFDLTPKGTLGCFHTRWPTPSLGVSELVTNRGQTLPGVAFAARAGTLWRLTKDAGPLTLERRVDDGAAYVATHAAALTDGAGPMVMVGDDLWLVGGKASLLKAHPEADGTLTLSRVPRPEVSADAIAGTERGLMIWSEQPDPNKPTLVFVTPAGVAENKPMTTATSVHWIAGADGDVLWTTVQSWSEEDQTTRAQLAVFTPSGVPLSPVNEVRAHYAPSIDVRRPDPTFGFFPPIVPMKPGTTSANAVRVPAAVPVFDGATIRFETFDVGDGFQQVGWATRTHVFALAMDGKFVKAFDR